MILGRVGNNPAHPEIPRLLDQRGVECIYVYLVSFVLLLKKRQFQSKILMAGKKSTSPFSGRQGLWQGSQTALPPLP